MVISDGDDDDDGDGDGDGDKLRNDCGLCVGGGVVNMVCVMVRGKSDMRAGGKYHWTVHIGG